MRIILAKEYEQRTVIRVVHNPSDPEWVHKVGEQQISIAGEPVFNGDGSPMLIESPDVPPGETGETCHNCHYNWRVSDHVWDGNERYYTDAEGKLVMKALAQYQAELTAIHATPKPAAHKASWIGSEF